MSHAIISPKPATFGTIDITDSDSVSFDWSRRAHPNDSIILAGIVSVPAGAMECGSVFIEPVDERPGHFDSPTRTAEDTWIASCRVTPSPSLANSLPITIGLRCTACFESGRRANYTIPITITKL